MSLFTLSWNLPFLIGSSPGSDSIPRTQATSHDILKLVHFPPHPFPAPMKRPEMLHGRQLIWTADFLTLLHIQMDAGEGEVDRPYVGLHLLELDADTALQMSRRNSKLPILAAGVLVTAVNKGSPADKAGLRAGDVITGWSSHLRISKAYWTCIFALSRLCSSRQQLTEFLGPDIICSTPGECCRLEIITDDCKYSTGVKELHHFMHDRMKFV